MQSPKSSALLVCILLIIHGIIVIFIVEFVVRHSLEQQRYILHQLHGRNLPDCLTDSYDSNVIHCALCSFLVKAFVRPVRLV